MRKLYLASASPRRRLLLQLITRDFTSISTDIEEKEYPHLSPRQKAVRRAKDKALRAVNSVKERDAVILSSDTVVELDGKVLDKPATKREAAVMMASLSGKSNIVHTAVVLCVDGIMHSLCRHTAVKFKTLPVDFINRYINSDEPYDKAGGYGIQGSAGRYIATISGDYYNVVGFPVRKVKKLLVNMKIV